MEATNPSPPPANLAVIDEERARRADLAGDDFPSGADARHGDSIYRADRVRIYGRILCRRACDRIVYPRLRIRLYFRRQVIFTSGGYSAYGRTPVATAIDEPEIPHPGGSTNGSECDPESAARPTVSFPKVQLADFQNAHYPFFGVRGVPGSSSCGLSYTLFAIALTHRCAAAAMSRRPKLLVDFLGAQL